MLEKTKISKTNIECYNAWRVNGLSVSPFVFVIKKLSKILQFPFFNRLQSLSQTQRATDESVS